MSMRSRARALQRATGLTYQQAQDRIKKLGPAPAELKKQTGWPLERCDLVLIDAEVEAITRGLSKPGRKPERPTPFRAACESLNEAANAEAVLWLGKDGGRSFAGSIGFLQLAGTPATKALKKGLEELRGFLSAHGLVDGFHLEPVGEHGVLVVVYGAASSLGLVRIAARSRAAWLKGVLDRVEPGWIVPGGGTPPSGAPAQAAAGIAWPTWTPPKPVDPN